MLVNTVERSFYNFRHKPLKNRPTNISLSTNLFGCEGASSTWPQARAVPLAVKTYAFAVLRAAILFTFWRAKKPPS